MHRGDRERVLNEIEKFSKEQYWHQHFFENTRRLICDIYETKIRFFNDSFEPGSDFDESPDIYTTEIEIFQGISYNEEGKLLKLLTDELFMPNKSYFYGPVRFKGGGQPCFSKIPN